MLNGLIPNLRKMMVFLVVYMGGSQMRCKLIAAVVLLVSFQFMPQQSFADVVEDAYRLCATFENTGMSTECKVSGWGSTVDVTIDTNGGEARKICAGLVEMMAEKTRSFAGKWKLRIFSPYSGERPIAVCTLR